MLFKANSEKFAVGCDLGKEYLQISFCSLADGRVETLSAVAGEEIYNIPTALCKRNGANQWTYGREALKASSQGKGILVENLLELAVDGESVQVEGSPCDPVALLALFLKRSLGLLSMTAPLDRISAILITCEKMNQRLLTVLGQAAAGLRMKNCRFCFQSHEESFYHYMIYQPEELWAFQSLLCEYREDRIRVLKMVSNKRTEPISVFMETEEFPFLRMDLMPGAETLKKERMERMDREFLDIVTQACKESLISSVYLIGEGYSQDWMKESLRYLCRGRRVFQGNNLYSKGACYGMLERLQPGETGRRHVFLGNDKLKANVGMRVLRRGEDSYYALLDAGVNWFEAENTCEFYLKEGNVLELVVTPLNGGEARLEQILLEGLETETARLRIHLRMEDERRLKAEVTDLGFGEFRPASGRVWEQDTSLI